ncbi:MAG: hypothetical protein ING44_13185 [Telmatospirillum sp.]|nr:hypothetical protein [Telmatospirillum sp.]
MSLFASVRVPIGGVLRLLRGDRSGLAALGAQTRGGWIASFVVPGVLILPAYFYLSLPDLDASDEPAHTLLLEALAYVVGLTLFPVAAHLLCTQWGKTRAWYDYVPAYNWAGVLQMAIYLPAAVLSQSETLDAVLLFLLGVAAVTAAVAIQYRVAVVVLGIDRFQALSLVALELALGAVLRQIVDRLQGG